MNKIYYLLLMPIFALFLSSCDENDEPDKVGPTMDISVESALNAENVTINIYSPDPHCLGYWYSIIATNDPNELIVKCKDVSSLKFTNKVYSDGVEYICQTAEWKAEIIGSNTIKFTFDEVAKDAVSDNFLTPVDLVFEGIKDDKAVKETITVWRIPSSLPDYYKF